MPPRTGRRQSPARQEQAVVPFDASARATKISELLDERRDQLAAYLADSPDSDAVARFRQVAFDAIVKDRNLLEADPISLLASIYHAAQMGLEPSSVMGEGAIVVYRDNDQNGKKIAQFQPMVRGLAKLARNSGQVTAIGVDVRHAKDHFVYRSGTDPKIEHEPWIDDDDPGDVLGAYAYAKLASGELVALYMSVPELLKRREVSRQWRSSGDQSIWGKWPEEMMKKTVLRRLLVEKVPLSFRLAVAVAADADDTEKPVVASVQARAPRRSRLAARLVADDAGDPIPSTEQAGNAPAGDPDPTPPDVAAQAAVSPPSEQRAPELVLCGAPSPYGSDKRCEQPRGHSGTHGTGRETWL